MILIVASWLMGDSKVSVNPCRSAWRRKYSPGTTLQPTPSMTKTTALVLDKSDFTKDGNLKAATFDAICLAGVVVHGDRVVKNRVTGEIAGPLDLDKEPDPEMENLNRNTAVPQPTAPQPSMTSEEY